ncbi:hypothetical protein IMCC1989_1547 [gamma proteobacterium IMCC1989]|nr:hypothetical protein IMCC1989_1547 [gamma proteobacterium IMCC1989]
MQSLPNYFGESVMNKNKYQTDKKAFDTLQTELQHAFSASESSYIELSADDIIFRNQTPADDP